MNRKSIAWLPLLSTLLGAAFPAMAQEKVRVALSNFSASYISMYSAQKRGCYAEEGMVVEIILMAGLTSTRALIGNSVELGSARNPSPGGSGGDAEDSIGV